MKKVIKNDVVSMEWDADTFYESKDGDFVAAINVYETSNGSVPVVFMDNGVFTLLDRDTEGVASVIDIEGVIKEAFINDFLIEDAYEDVYINLGVGSVTELEIAESLGLSEEVIADIDKRLADLQGYWGTYEEDMC